MLPALPGWRAGSPADYHAHRIALGIPEGGTDFAFGEAFPHDADMDQLGGVDFRKGCYIGQEVVSRMEHRGTSRRRIVLAASLHALPSGAPITADGKPLGQVMSVAGSQGLAQIRVDRAKAAMDAGLAVLAADVPVSLTLPAWARFGWATSPSED
jgi:folate-binding protein YgfZ